MPQSTLRKKLREELTRHLVPALRARGYEGPDAIKGNAILHEFRRPGPGGLQSLSLQFDKWQRPHFIINLWVEPPGGVESLVGSGLTVINGRVRAPGGGWFRADRPWWQRLFGMSATREHEAALAAVATLDEVEQWWQTQKPSKSIINFPTTFVNDSTSRSS